MIVKVQTPIAGNSEPLALIYDRERKHEALIPYGDDLVRAMNYQPKAFFKARIVDGKIQLLERVKDRSW